MIARSGKVSLFILSLLLLLVPVGALGQTAGTGQIVGTVTDKSGAVVVDATVTLTDTATNDVRTTISNDAGRYAFPNVVPGKYNVSINKAGFKQTKLPDLEVLVSETRTLDVRLDIGSAAEIVEVTSTNTEMQTMNATIGNTITGRRLGFPAWSGPRRQHLRLAATRCRARRQRRRR